MYVMDGPLSGVRKTHDDARDCSVHIPEGSEDRPVSPGRELTERFRG